MKNLKILIVDDDKDVHEIMKFYLSEFAEKFLGSNQGKNDLLSRIKGNTATKTSNEIPYNLDVAHAYQGQEGVAMIHENDYDLVILDILMPPGINGTEVMKQISEFSFKPCLLVSTAYHQDLLDNIMLLGERFEQAYLMKKPFEFDSLCDLLQSTLLKKDIALGPTVVKI
jgi:CheY-like chemotaxis protein